MLLKVSFCQDEATSYGYEEQTNRINGFGGDAWNSSCQYKAQRWQGIGSI